MTQHSKFVPFSSEQTSLSTPFFTAENSPDRLSIYGIPGLTIQDITRDAAGLAIATSMSKLFVGQLWELLDQTLVVLRNLQDKGELPDKVAPLPDRAALPVVANPFA